MERSLNSSSNLPSDSENTLKRGYLNLKIISINTNSIISHSKRFELIKFLDIHEPDIVLLCETKLNKRHKIQFLKYEIVRTGRPNSLNGGGTAILLKRDLNITWSQIFKPSPTHNNILEYTVVKLELNNINKVYIVSAYANNEPRNIFINELNELFISLKLDDLNNYYIIAGDLNCRQVSWGDTASNYKGHFLNEWETRSAHLYKAQLYTPHAPTFPSSGSYLDLSIIDSRINVTNLVNNKLDTLSYNSDQEALYIIINVEFNDDIIFTNKEKIGNFIFKKTKWKKFTKVLNDDYLIDIPSNSNLSHDEIDNHLNLINLSILRTINSCVPKYEPSNNTLNYVNNKIRKLHDLKSKLVSILKSHKRSGYNNFDNLTIQLKDSIKLISEKINLEFKHSYTKYWESQHKLIDHKKTEWFFPSINSLFRHKPPLEISELHVPIANTELINRCNIDTSDLTKDADKFIILDPRDKINIIRAHYEKINSPRYTNIGTNTKAIVDREITSFTHKINNFKENIKSLTNFSNDNPAHDPKYKRINDEPYFCNIPHVQLLLKQLPNKTSSGIDGIPPIVLKNLPLKIIKNYTILFNNCLNLCYFPSAWKKAKVLPILKKGKNPSEPVSYRPISLTPSISKVYKSVINSLINYHTSKNKVIPDNHFGFVINTERYTLLTSSLVTLILTYIIMKLLVHVLLTSKKLLILYGMMDSSIL